MVLSSISEERAKYKKLMVNWLVAICLVFFLHYIMAVIMFATEKLVTIIGDGLDGSEYTVRISGNEETFHLKYGAKIGGGATENIEGDWSFTARVYNLTELARVYVSAQNRGIAFSYLLVYLVLVVYTIIFIFKYLKRYIYMAFLTMIAPIIAFTYPIDKMGDSKSQAFNSWFTEYLFNALLQPLHLIIYMVLVGSAIELTQSNPLYAIVALAFITQAEKLLRKFFGLDKAASVGSAGGAFAKGALASQAINTLKSGGNSVTSKALGGGSGASEAKGYKPRTANLNSYLGGNGDSSGGNTPRTNNQLVQGDNSIGSIDATNGATGSYEEMGPWQKTNMSKEEYQEKYGSSVPWKLDEEDNKSSTNTLENNPQTFKDLDKDKNTSNKLNTKNTNLDKPKKEKKKINGYKNTRKLAVAKTVGKGLGKAAIYTGKKLGKGAIRTAAAIPGAMLGGAMAIATGDTSYLAAGAAAGVALGGKAANALGKAPKAIRTAYRNERLGAQGAKDKARFEEFKKNKNNIDYFKQQYNLSTKQAKAMIEEGKEFVEAGYTNVEDVDRLIDMQRASQGSSNSEEIMAADQMASQLKLEDLLDSKKATNLENNLSKQMQYQAQIQGKDISEDRAKELARKHINNMRASKGLPPTATTEASKENVEKVTKPRKDTSELASSGTTSNKKSAGKDSSNDKNTRGKK